jgi:hypothetical protein
MGGHLADRQQPASSDAKRIVAGTAEQPSHRCAYADPSPVSTNSTECFRDVDVVISGLEGEHSLAT